MWLDLHAADGALVRRVRLCWAAPPRAADVVRAVAARQLAARRAGLRVVVRGDAVPLLRAAGLIGPAACGDGQDSSAGSPNSVKTTGSRK